MHYYTIGELSRITNLNIETIRYYEKINLIPNPERFQNGYKKYSEMYVYKLKIIIKAKNYGFTLHEINNFFSQVSDKEEINKTNLNDMIKSKVDDIEKECERLLYKKEQLLSFQEEVDKLECPVLNKIINKKSS